MNPPCVALMGYVPGRYVEPEPKRGRPPAARKPTLRFLCEACHLRWVTQARYRACSTTCAGLLRKRGKARRAQARFKAAMAALGKD